jgi:hypothetical protein
MPTSLNDVRQRLATRLSIINGGFDRLLLARSGGFRVDRFALQEGLISQLWQAWGSFCRQTTIGSAQGSLTASGNLTTSPYSTLSEGELAFVAKMLVNGKKITAGRKSLPIQLEPTWGDTSKLILITSGLSATNSGNLLSAFGSTATLKDLHICRNANAHLTKYQISGIKSAAVRYNSPSFRHPSDMMYWEDPFTRDFLWRSWILEIDTVSSIAIL